MICPHSSFYPIGPSDCIWRLSVLIIVAFVQPAHFCLVAALRFCSIQQKICLATVLAGTFSSLDSF